MELKKFRKEESKEKLEGYINEKTKNVSNSS